MQGLSLLKVARVEAFCETAIDWSEKIASFLPHVLIEPKSRHAHRRPQLPGLRLVRTRNGERALEICSRLRRTQLRQLQRNLAGYAMDFGLVPTFLCCFHRGYRFGNAAPSVIKLAEFRIRLGQM